MKDRKMWLKFIGIKIQLQSGQDRKMVYYAVHVSEEPSRRVADPRFSAVR